MCGQEPGSVQRTGALDLQEVALFLPWHLPCLAGVWESPQCAQGTGVALAVKGKSTHWGPEPGLSLPVPHPAGSCPEAENTVLWQVALAAPGRLPSTPETPLLGVQGRAPSPPGPSPHPDRKLHLVRETRMQDCLHDKTQPQAAHGRAGCPAWAGCAEAARQASPTGVTPQPARCFSAVPDGSPTSQLSCSGANP